MTTPPPTSEARPPRHLLRDFADWARARAPIRWDNAIDEMPRLVAAFLSERYPSEGAERLDELARAAVQISERRISVDWRMIVDGLAN